MEERLRACCGSSRWVRLMLEKRPFEGVDDLKAKAREVDAMLTREDWLEAFAAHPEIGTKKQTISKWEAQEQSGAMQANECVLEELQRCNVEYKMKFGYIYIVCATGKSAKEMLEIVKERLLHSPEEELGIAAREQAKITQIRLEKLEL